MARNDSCKACREAFEDAVQALGDDGSYQTSNGMNGSRSVSPSAKIPHQVTEPHEFRLSAKRGGSTQV